MADPFISEIRMFGFNFAPLAWAQCAGQIMPIQQNTALFSLIGTYFGGNGTSNFALPNLQGNVPLSTGQGSGLSDYFLGETGGVPSVTLLTTTMPAHTHVVNGDKDTAGSTDPTNNVYKQGEKPGSPASAIFSYNTNSATLTPLNPQTITPAGNPSGAVPHTNIMPTMALNFCICLQGVFPQRA
jgi:microcystin-dependent protein